MRVLLVVLLVSLTGLASGQTSNASIVGAVTDPSGGAVPGATVVITNTGTGVSREVQTSAVGAYRVYPLHPGTYEVSAFTEGFKTKIQPNVRLESAAELKIDFELEIGDVNESVEVTGAPPVLQTQEASVGGVISTAQLERTPVNGRNYTRLMILMPGSSDVHRPGGEDLSGALRVSVNGQRNRDNNYTLDGVGNNFMQWNSTGSSPPMDSIHEFRVATNNSAEFGGAAGANVNVTSRSGTSDLHGSLYWYVRNDKFDANPWFNNREGLTKTPFKQNQYGASFGGPVVLPKLYDGRDRTFWFVNWEGFRRRRAETLRLTSPTAAMRAGDFSGIANIFDPMTGEPDGEGKIIRQPFPGNRIPAAQIHPSMTYLLDLMMPMPNQPGLTRNFIRQESLKNDSDKVVIRADHVIGPKDNIFGRLLHQKVGQLTPQENPNEVREGRFDTLNVAAGWNHIFSSSTILETRYAYHHPWTPNCWDTKNTTRAEFLRTAEIKLFDPNGLCNVLPAFDITGWFGVGNAGGGNSIGDVNNQFVANVSKEVGRHSLKFGVDYTYRQYESNASPLSYAPFRASLTASDYVPESGNSVATLLLGYPSSISRALGVARGRGRQHALGGYVQDNWRVTNRLTINLGLRYEFHNAPIDVNDSLGNLLLTRNPETGVVEADLMWAGVNPLPDPETGEVNSPPRRLGYGRALKKNDYNNFGPRVGIAWQLNDKTVVRTGFGAFYNSTFMQEFQDMRKFWPYLPLQSFTTNRGLRPNLSITDQGPEFSSTQAIGGWPQNPNNRSPYSLQWNLFLQRQILANMTLDIGYVGSANRKQIGYYPWNNAPEPGPGPVGPRRLLASSGFGGGIQGGGNEFNSNYNALQVKLNKRFSQGVQVLANYTWGRCMTGQSSLSENQTQDFMNRRPDHGRCTYDIKHAFKAGYVWDLPFGHGRAYGGGWHPFVDALLGAWSIEGLIQIQTGSASTVITRADRANVGTGGERANVLFDPNLGGRRNPDRMFATEAFELPPKYTWGNSGVGIIEDDGRNVWDISVAKRFRLVENHTLEVRAEFFNIMNHVNFINGRGWTLTSPTFGTTREATTERQIQFALRYRF